MQITINLTGYVALNQSLKRIFTFKSKVIE